jgi:hypothetical protein
MKAATLDTHVRDFLAQKRIAVAGVSRGISVIAGACPMMYGAGVDVGHTCM